ncbi:phage integrase [Yersinia enterocolitica]|uniref:phage integrase n=1 Tax=Yersinia enterocolitica TaxID=630 RepID=UPI00398CE4D9
MTISKLESGQYLVDVRPQGRNGKRMRKRFDTKSEAQQYERWLIATQNNKGWIEKPADRRLLIELIELWWKYHGQTLKAGKDDYQRLKKLADDMKNPRADQVTKSSFADYKAARLSSGISPSTINRTQMILSGVFSTLIESGHYHSQHPLKGIGKIKKTESEMYFLSRTEIDLLLKSFDGDNLKVIKLCLATGARWEEAAELTSASVIKYKVTFNNTKNGKNRTVPISAKLYKDVYKSEGGRLFQRVDYDFVRETLRAVIPSLPVGQSVRVFRHTFASHFMMNGGNILTLQKILGHSNIQQTMTYAHFAPDHLQDAVKFNPLEQ